MNHIIVISPHPDDEALGCGGTIRKHVIDGDMVEVIFLTSGENGGKGIPKEELATAREQESQIAAKILGISKTEFWREPDGFVHVRADMVKRLQEKIENINAKIIYVPHEQESHPDHKAAASLVSLCINQLSRQTSQPVVWMYEVWTPMQRIEHIVDISDYVDVKRQAIHAHKSQCAMMKFDEAILGLNRYRGEMHSWPGGDYAEIFKGMNR